MALKFVVLVALGRAFRLQPGDAFLLAFALAQGGEFAFVLFSFATQQAVLQAELASLLTAAVALSMAAAPVLLVINHTLVQPRCQPARPQRPADPIDQHTILSSSPGFGASGTSSAASFAQMALAPRCSITTLIRSKCWRPSALKSFYGDASRLELLEAAGAAAAKLLILAIEDESKALPRSSESFSASFRACKFWRARPAANTLTNYFGSA